MKKEDELTVETKPIEETVKITLPLTREKQDDVFVAVNGHTWQLQRGVEVEVPKVVYEVLQNSALMDSLALRRQQELQKQSF